jgi:DNA-directed RNA polymerase subunit RPC12/RpoP
MMIKMSSNTLANTCFKCKKGILTLIEKTLWKCKDCGFEIYTKQKEYLEQWCMKCPEWPYRDSSKLLAECGNTTYPCPINNYVKERNLC